MCLFVCFILAISIFKEVLICFFKAHNDYDEEDFLNLTHDEKDSNYTKKYENMNIENISTKS